MKCKECGERYKDTTQAHKYDNICPHTTSPLQLKSLCQRCRKLDILGIWVYQMPDNLGGDWAASVNCIISDGFKNRHDAEEWALGIPQYKRG